MKMQAVSLAQWQRKYSGEFVALDRRRGVVLAHSSNPREVVKRIRTMPAMSQRDLIVTFLPKSPASYLLILF